MNEKELIVGRVYDIPIHSNVIKSIPCVYIGKKKYYSNSLTRHIVALRSLITGETEINTFTRFSMRGNLLVMKHVRRPDLSDSEKQYLEERLGVAGL